MGHMSVSSLANDTDFEAAGAWVHERIREWYPLCRSITGEGLRATLQAVGGHIPLEIVEVPTGTAVFDWTVPREWNIRDAYVKNAAGERVVDFHAHNLHVLGYSVPVHETVSLDTLKAHCFSIPEQPTRIPFRNSFYKDNWGFCLAHDVLSSLPPGDYEVCIDSSLEEGSLTYGECYIHGERQEEIFFSAHACHPSLANDNLSGVASAAWLAMQLAAGKPRYSYRFLFAPGTIGAITWLARNEENAARMHAGFVLACLGDGGDTHYKRSRQGGAPGDRAAAHVLSRGAGDYHILPFTPYGYDERQYCSPGFNLPVGCFMRTPPGGYPEYHTSADNPGLVRADMLGDSLGKLARVLEVIEGDGVYRNQNPKCEPMLGKRGLYGAIGGRTDTKAMEMALLWVLNQSDGAHSLLDIADASGYDFTQIREAADALVAAGLLA